MDELDVQDVQPVDWLRVAPRLAASEPLLQAAAVATAAVAVSQAGEMAAWFALALLGGISLSGSL